MFSAIINTCQEKVTLRSPTKIINICSRALINSCLFRRSYDTSLPAILCLNYVPDSSDLLKLTDASDYFHKFHRSLFCIRAKRKNTDVGTGHGEISGQRGIVRSSRRHKQVAKCPAIRCHRRRADRGDAGDDVKSAVIVAVGFALLAWPASWRMRVASSPAAVADLLKV